MSPNGIVGDMASDNNGRPRELSTSEAATYCGYTLGYFYIILKQIRHRKERGRLFFPVDALDEFRASQSYEHVPVEEPAA